MKNSTKQRKQSASHIQQLLGEDNFALKVAETISWGKKSIDSLNQEIGKMLVESILLMDRENIASPDYAPNGNVYKWAHQPGSVFIGDQKTKISKPRLRGPQGEIHLPSYEKLKERGSFSEELLTMMMSGLSARRYHETVQNAAQAFGVSPSSVSRHFVEATSRPLKEFLERSLSDFHPFAIMLDTARLSSRVIFVTDGGKGIIKALKDKFGKKLLHQRCTLHKDHNLQKHVAKKYRQQIHKKYVAALAHRKYEDAKRALESLEKELMQINASAARSLREALPELLTRHQLEVHEDLYKVLHTTNGIENLFSSVRHREHNVKNYNPEYRGKKRKGKLSQRWLVAVFLKVEENFRTVKGFQHIQSVIERIEKLQTEMIDNKIKKAA